MISIPDVNCQFPRLAGPREITHKLGLSFVTYTIAIDIYLSNVFKTFFKTSILGISKSRYQDIIILNSDYLAFIFTIESRYSGL